MKTPRYQYKVTEWPSPTNIHSTIDEHLAWAAGEGPADWRLAEVLGQMQQGDETRLTLMWERDSRQKLTEY